MDYLFSFSENKREKKEPVLVFSNLGISRSAAIVIAYMMYYKNCSDKV
jgi:protein-tyrosine phosphatase